MESILEIEKDIRIISKNDFSIIISFLVNDKTFCWKTLNDQSKASKESKLHPFTCDQNVVNFLKKKYEWSFLSISSLPSIGYSKKNMLSIYFEYNSYFLAYCIEIEYFKFGVALQGWSQYIY